MFFDINLREIHKQKCAPFVSCIIYCFVHKHLKHYVGKQKKTHLNVFILFCKKPLAKKIQTQKFK